MDEDIEIVTHGMNNFTLNFLKKNGINGKNSRPPTGPYTNIIAFNLLRIRKNQLLKKYMSEVDNSNYIYIYSGSYLPNKKINPMTVIVDYYCTLKPWLVSFKGYQVFDIYIEYYNKVNKVFSLEYDLPASHWNAIYRLYKKGFLYLDIISFSFPLVGIHIYRLGSLFRAFFRLLK